ncbi:MAG: zinc-binding dehydrogenase [Schleiferilactobacillus harbinensis]|jgi:L-iditol 2-dehydrogenase|nr:zinc-binding dehydrogenase [Schleiferilactobacillus harbinensis]MCI1913600.1 zinc-binding dehydrogenase [Schleiferilactobacillus harbinensis]
MSYEIATLNEPFSVSIHAAQLLGIKPGSSVFISGGGPVGLLAILAARTFGAHQIIVSDTQDLRLQTAKKIGADRVINALKEDPRKVIAEMTNGEGVDFVLEASGNPKAEQAALRTLKRGGKLAYIGVPTTDAVPLDIPFMTDHETQVFGIFRYANTYPLGLEVLEKHMDLAENLLTDFYPLSQTKDALEKTRTDKGESLKVVIYPNEQLRHN